MAQETDIDRLLEDFADQIQETDDGIMQAVVGVAQALDDVRKAADKTDQCLDDRKFDAAAQLGYGDISSAFVFLQRTLGGLQSAVHRKEALASEVAFQAKQAYEDVEPAVTRRFKSYQPRSTGKGV